MTVGGDSKEITIKTWGEWKIQLLPMIFNARLVMAHQDDALGYTYGWCYRDTIPAIIAALGWDPDTEDEPPGWHKRPTQPRYAPNRAADAVLRCDHGTYTGGRCEYVGCEHWVPDTAE